MHVIRWISLFVAFIFLALPAAASDYGLDAVRDGDRRRLARTIYRHDFENRRDPETGLPVPESADLNNNGWPDFWEPIRAVGFPEYLFDTIAVAPDRSGQIPGAYRDEVNHALRIGFDGTRVGIRTRELVPIDPGLAYQFSLRVRDAGLHNGRIRAGVDWIRVDPAAVEVVRSDEIHAIPLGQTDWAVTPARMLINDPPVTANAARLYIIVDRQPGAIGGSYHGEIWVDDIELRPHPKIMIGRLAQGPAGESIIPVRYTGLFDNVPDPANPGYFRGKRYYRRVEVTDINNRPVSSDLRERRIIEPDEDGDATEEIVLPRTNYGVYYFNIRLYDADERLSSDVMRAVAVMRPADAAGRDLTRSGRPSFGVRAGEVPESILEANGLLRSLLLQTGVRYTKIIPWRNEYGPPASADAYYTMLAEEVRGLRGGGLAVTGVIRPPVSIFGKSAINHALSEQSEALERLMVEAGRRLGLFMDSWQWGTDADASLAGSSGNRTLDRLSRTLEEFAGGMPVVGNIPLAGQSHARLPASFSITEGFLDDETPSEFIWQNAASWFPWLFEPYFRVRGAIYPPARLSRLAPAPAVDLIEEMARSSQRRPVWFSLQVPAADPHEPNAAAERRQLEEMLIRAVYAAVLSPEVIFLGDLFDPFRGMLRRDLMGDNIIDAMARPTFLAAGTVARMLEGTEYLGQIGLLPPFEAHAFRRIGTDDAVIAIWHNESGDERPLPREEIANGPPLLLVDWAGNSQPLPRSIPVQRVPSFITGMSAALVLTRMSVRVAPEPSLLAMSRNQVQQLEVVNHMPYQAPIQFRLRYAARSRDGAMENGWAVSPEELRINALPAGPAFTPGRLRYTAAPDPNSPIQYASPEGADSSGSKLAQVNMSVNTSPPADMLLYLPFSLKSELDVEIEPLYRVDDPHFVTLQLKIRWFPSPANRRRGEIRLVPSYIKRGRMKEEAPFPISVKASLPEDRGNPNVMFESFELRVPRNPMTQTWVGLSEEGGSNFYLAEVTEFLLQP